MNYSLGLTLKGKVPLAPTYSRALHHLFIYFETFYRRLQETLETVSAQPQLKKADLREAEIHRILTGGPLS